MQQTNEAGRSIRSLYPLHLCIAQGRESKQVATPSTYFLSREPSRFARIAR